VQPLDPVGHRPPVREQAAEPAVVDVRHADAPRLDLDGVLRLLLRADEEDGAVAFGEVAAELLGLLEALRGLRQVDDVDAAALREDEAAHLRVPASRLVAEVDSGLQQVAHRDCASGCGPSRNGHRRLLPDSFVVLRRRGSRRTTREEGHARRGWAAGK
jgi:hypothetical protein